MRILYIDMINAAHAQSNVQGRIRAYRKVAQLETFDYRAVARRLGVMEMNERLVAAAIQFEPDLVQFGKCESVKGWAVERIKQQTGAVVIHFYGDYRPKVQRWVADIGRVADWTLLYHQDERLIQAHLDAGCRRVGYWGVGIDPDTFKPADVERDHDIAFMANAPAAGTGQGEGRWNLVRALAVAGLSVHLYGNGWGKLRNTPNIYLHNFVEGGDFAQACSRAKLCLGYNTNQVRMYTSWRRVFNSMASGACFLTRWFPGLETVFVDGIHLVWFKDIEGAVSAAHHYIARDAEREAIAAAGRQAVLEGHTWDHIIGQCLQYVEMAKG